MKLAERWGAERRGTTNGTKDANGDWGWGGTLNFERGTLNVEVGRLGPFFARAELPVLCSSYEGFAIAKRAGFARGRHWSLFVSSIFLGFCYRELAKKFGEWCFFWRGRGFGPGEAEGTIREKLCRWCLRRLRGVPMVGGYDWDLR